VELAMLVVHGLGSPEPDYADGLRDAVSRRLERAGHDPGAVAWAPVYWADLLAGRQAAYLQRAEAAGALRWDAVRAFVVEGLGDAAAYQYVDRPSATYVAVHDRIRAAVRGLHAGPLASAPVPLVVLAHSLGSHMASSYIWDTQAGKPTGAGPGASAFERMAWLAGMITFGSTIPLFTFAYDPVVPIAFPGGDLPAPVRAVARWTNYYDPDDALGWPLKPTGPAYDRVVAADRAINVGGLLEAWNPGSHNGYWGDSSFTGPVADQLAALLDASRLSA
jgi:hypothetical protein